MLSSEAPEDVETEADEETLLGDDLADELDDTEDDESEDFDDAEEDTEESLDEEDSDETEPSEAEDDDDHEGELDGLDAESASPRPRSTRASRLALRRAPKGKAAWDKDRTRRLFHEYKTTGSTEARDQLIMSHLNLVRFLASKFKNRGEPLDDLVQVGTIGLIKAIDRFDPDRGLEFTTYATPTILGEIKRHFRDKGWSVRVPRRLQDLSQKVKGATDDLAIQLGHTPSVSELAEYLGASVDDVLEAMEASSAYSSVSFEKTSNPDDEDALTLMDSLGDEDRDLTGTDDRLLLDEVISSFSPREQQVVRMRFIEGLTQVEIANQLGISQVQVSRLLRKTLGRLQEKIGAAGLLG